LPAITAPSLLAFVVRVTRTTAAKRCGCGSAGQPPGMADYPQYLVKSKKSGGEADHKPGALKKK
jgi:hypothetical protein